MPKRLLRWSPQGYIRVTELSLLWFSMKAPVLDLKFNRELVVKPSV